MLSLADIASKLRVSHPEWDVVKVPLKEQYTIAFQMPKDVQPALQTMVNDAVDAMPDCTDTIVLGLEVKMLLTNDKGFAQ